LFSLVDRCHNPLSRDPPPSLLHSFMTPFLWPDLALAKPPLWRIIAGRESNGGDFFIMMLIFVFLFYFLFYFFFPTWNDKYTTRAHHHSSVVLWFPCHQGGGWHGYIFFHMSLKGCSLSYPWFLSTKHSHLLISYIFLIKL